MLADGSAGASEAMYGAAYLVHGGARTGARVGNGAVGERQIRHTCDGSRGGRVQAQMRTGVSQAPVQMCARRGLVSVCRCGWGEPDLGVAGVSPVPVSMVQGLRTVGYCEYSRSTHTGVLCVLTQGYFEYSHRGFTTHRRRSTLRAGARRSRAAWAAPPNSVPPGAMRYAV